MIDRGASESVLVVGWWSAGPSLPSRYLRMVQGVGRSPARTRVVRPGRSLRVVGPTPIPSLIRRESRVRAAAHASPSVRSRPKPVPPTKGSVHGLSIVPYQTNRDLQLLP
jgi:hypothetical protein